MGQIICLGQTEGIIQSHAQDPPAGVYLSIHRAPKMNLSLKEFSIFENSCRIILKEEILVFEKFFYFTVLPHSLPLAPLWQGNPLCGSFYQKGVPFPWKIDVFRHVEFSVWFACGEFILLRKWYWFHPWYWLRQFWRRIKYHCERSEQYHSSRCRRQNLTETRGIFSVKIRHTKAVRPTAGLLLYNWCGFEREREWMTCRAMSAQSCMPQAPKKAAWIAQIGRFSANPARSGLFHGRRGSAFRIADRRRETKKILPRFC